MVNENREPAPDDALVVKLCDLDRVHVAARCLTVALLGEGRGLFGRSLELRL